MIRQPNGIRIEEAHKVLEHYGYKLDRQNGSHRQYVAKGKMTLTIAVRTQSLKPFYVNLVLSRIEADLL